MPSPRLAVADISVLALWRNANAEELRIARRSKIVM